MVWSHTFEQHSASFMQALLFAVHATHWPLEHFVLALVQSLFAQQSWQLPLQQCWPGEHAFPQAPQLLESVCSLTHMPPQQLSPF